MRISLAVLTAIAATSLAACAMQAPRSYPSTTTARLATYAKAKACCDDPSGFQFNVLPQQGNADADVDLSSPVFDFQSGLSPFAAFELPAETMPYRVRIKSLFDGHGGDETAVFYPVIALLDDTFIVVHLSGLENLRLEPALATVGGEAGLAVSIGIDPAENRGKYLVVFTPAVLLGIAPDIDRENDMLSSEALAWIERRGDGALPASPYGRLRITVAPEISTAKIAPP